MRILRQDAWNLYLLMTGSTKQEKTGKHKKAPNTKRKTNKSTTRASRRRRKNGGRTGTSRIQGNVDIGGCIVLHAADGQLLPGTIHDTPRQK